MTPTVRPTPRERLSDALFDRVAADPSGVYVYDVTNPADRDRLAGFMLDVFNRQVTLLHEAEKTIDRVMYLATRPDKDLDETVQVRDILKAVRGRGL